MIDVGEAFMGTEKTSKKGSTSARKVWIVNETLDSNPRLAENLSLLSDALHMELEPVRTEAWIGNYNGDILADDNKSDAAIVIEHLSDETYHYQLGQVLACAENYNARILIWIADNFREEHRSALDWLNRWTSKDIEVYGVEIRSAEDDADANLKFVPIIAPASWSNRSESKPIPNIHSVVLREFFQGLLVDLHDADEFKDIEKFVTKNAHSFPSGLPGIHFSASFEGNLAWVYIPGWPSVNNRILNQIRNDSSERAKIEAKLDLPSNTSIAWKTGANSIGVYRKGSLDDSEEELEAIRQWMLHYLIKFKKVFNPRMKRIIAELETTDK